jgi:hypothetical protein
MSSFYYLAEFLPRPKAESKENMVDGTWDTIPELTITCTLCPLQSRLQHIYYEQPYARVGLNPMPESTLSPSQGLLISALSWQTEISFKVE